MKLPSMSIGRSASYGIVAGVLAIAFLGLGLGFTTSAAGKHRPSAAKSARALDVFKPGGLWFKPAARRRANLIPPSLSGSGEVGDVLRCRPGKWSGSGAFSFSWRRDDDGFANPSPSPKTYVPAPSDVGSSIRCSVARGTSGAINSNAIAISALPLPVNQVLPSISPVGPVPVGTVLRCNPGTWTETGTYNYGWTRDGVALAATAKAYTTLAADGGHMIACRVSRSGPGATSAPASSAAVSVTGGSGDTTPPETTIDSGPSGTIAVNSASFTFSSNEAGSTFECAIDSSAMASCSSPKTYTPLTQGQHTFEVRAIDPAGNIDPTPANRTFTVDVPAPDTTPPTSAHSLAPASPNGTNNWYTSAPTVTLSCTDNAGGSGVQKIEYRLAAAAAFSTYAAPFAISAQGTTTLQYRCFDNSGNQETPDHSVAVKLDTLVPDTTITSGPSEGATITTASTSFAFSSTEAGSSFNCQRDGSGGFTAGACAMPWSGLTNGAHSFAVRATDQAGNTDASPAVRNFTVDLPAPDTTPPTSSHSLAPASPDGANGWYTSAPTVTLSCTDNPGGSGVQKIEYRLATSGPYTTYSTPFAISAQGTTTVESRCTDNAGNVESPNHSFQVKRDSAAPNTTIDSGPANGSTITVDSAAFTFSSPDATATFECKLDDAAYSTCTTPRNLTALPNGSHTFSVRAVDPAGNVDPSPASRTFVVSAGGGGPTEVEVYGTFSLSWVPEALNLQVGDSILWRFDKSDQAGVNTCGVHNVAMASDADFGSLDPSAPNPAWLVYGLTPCNEGTGTPPAFGESVGYTFAQTGSFTWVCEIHQGMFGHVNVTAR